MNMLWLNSIKKAVTGTTVGTKQALDVFVAGGGGGTQTEDALHVSGDQGQMALAVRNDAGAALAGDGDYIPLSTDASGNLRVAASLTESAVAADGAAAPALVKVAGGVDGVGNTQALRTDTNGELQIDVLSSSLPTGAATETTLAAASAKLPATLGQKTMAASMAVVLASDQSAVPVSGPVTDVQLRASAVPVSAASLPLPAGAATAALQAKTPINTTGDAATNAAVGAGAVITLTAPANAVGFSLQADDANTANVRWRQGVDPTASAGQGLAPGQDTGYFPCAANVRAISVSGTQTVHINWVLQ